MNTVIYKVFIIKEKMRKYFLGNHQKIQKYIHIFLFKKIFRTFYTNRMRSPEKNTEKNFCIPCEFKESVFFQFALII